MTERKVHLDGVAALCLIGCCFLCGLNQVAAKAALPEVRRCSRRRSARSAARPSERR